MVCPPRTRYTERLALYFRKSRLMRLIGLLHNPRLPQLSNAPVDYIESNDVAISSNDIKLLDKLLKNSNAEALLSGAKTAEDLCLQLVQQKSAYGLKLHEMVVTVVPLISNQVNVVFLLMVNLSVH